MKARNITVIGLWAMVGLVTALAIGLPPQLNAVNDARNGTVAVAKLKIGGVTLSMAPALSTPVKAGDKPEFVLIAENTTDEPAQAEVNVAMVGQRLASDLSRIGPMPQEMWRESRKLELKPNETLRVNMASVKAVEAGKEYFLTLAPVTDDQKQAKADATTKPSKVAFKPFMSVPGSVRALAFSIPADKTKIAAKTKWRSQIAQKASPMNKRARISKNAMAQRK